MSNEGKAVQRLIYNEIFFTSDLHFWHKNVIEFCNRPWPDVEAMNQGLIDNWNSVVGDKDAVFICGDLFFCGKQKAKEIAAQLKGDKYWILGNHDWGKIPERRAEEFGFKFMGPSYELKLHGTKVLLSHFPYTGDHTDDPRYLEHRLKDQGDWLLHGHVHNAWKIKGNQINVGVDVWDYKPVSAGQILEVMNTFNHLGLIL